MTGPAMLLACLTDPDAESHPWRELLAPEVSWHPVHAEITELAGRTPYALFGAGHLGHTAYDLAGRLSATGHGPSRLVLWRCPPPDTGFAGLDCPIVLFTDAESADDQVSWRTASTAGFTLRVLTRDQSPHDIALAVKEELQVWPL
ncbi:hypothetical protein ALI144C_36535 [Actinosynnema sp. ALI-1.44]|uniref:hypothetical protein n=1 Tax=Actinosynnema sp. ALI-1.44 TaxID=1933779 RepID=UPI00097BF471|nr:hypothetical protein [Actinosynnema sp. ALI-1.44]ONI76184.1 hypothetical protein ALI144C_36535 [Actinosynnema sp. ALI-1.44]